MPIKMVTHAFVLAFLLFNATFAAYAGATPNSGLAIVIIDMQSGFYERGHTTNTPGLRSLVEQQMELLKWGVENDVPVLFFEYRNYGASDPRLTALLKNHPHASVIKATDGGFDGEESKGAAISQLKEWNVDTLIVSGINGNACVVSTARGAVREGFDVMTSADIVGNINQNPPIYPNSTWYFNDHKFVVFDSLDKIIH